MKEPKIRFKGFQGEWEIDKIGNFSTSFSGGTPTAGISAYYGGNIPFIRSGEIHEDKTELSLTEKGYNNSSAKIVEKGTLLYALYGATSGDVAISKIRGAINQAILAIIPYKSVETDFLADFLLCNKNKIVGELLQGGQGNLSGSLVKDINVTYPCLSEQRAIASYFQHLDALIQSTTKKIESLKQVKAASLQSMFPQEGETTPRVRFKGFEGEWEETTIGESMVINSGMDYKHLSEGDVPVYGTGGYMLSVNECLSEVDAIGIGRKGTIDKPQLLKAPFWTVDTLFFLTPQNKELHFLYALCQKINWRNYDESTGVPSLSKVSVSKIKFAVPSYAEQRAIASYFTTLDRQITLQTQRLEKLKQIKSACLDNMFV